MKTAIYYFTGTGNSLAVSKDLAAELDEGKHVVDILPIAKFYDQDSIKVDADTIGIVFPVYCLDIPPIIKTFAKKLNLNGAYVFALATCNGSPGNALFNLNTLLEKQGNRLASGFHISMPGNSVLAIDLTTNDEENEKRFGEEKIKIKSIAEAVKNKKHLGIEGKFNPDEKYEAKVYLDNIYKVQQQFWVTESCNQCGICQDICPKKNIEMIGKEIIWHDNCEYCLACLHWCPNAAIQNGEISQNCRRYHHPDITLKEMLK